MLADRLELGNLYTGDNSIDPSKQGIWQARQDTVPSSKVVAARGHSVIVSVEATTDSRYWSGWYFDSFQILVSC